jgi:CHRD domain-containing protein
MDGGQETMPNASMGPGAIRVEVSGATDTIRILMFATELSGDVTGVNLHTTTFPAGEIRGQL